MPTYLLAGSARIAGRRYVRGDELPDHDQTKALLDRDPPLATTDPDDLLRETAPALVGGTPKAEERSSVGNGTELLVSDGAGFHAETAFGNTGEAKTTPVTSSGDGAPVTQTEETKEPAKAPAAKTGARAR